MDSGITRFGILLDKPFPLREYKWADDDDDESFPASQQERTVQQYTNVFCRPQCMLPSVVCC